MFVFACIADLMLIDSDINFNASDIFRLMAWNTDPKKGIVGGVPVARKKGSVYISTLDQDPDGGIYMNSFGLVKAKRLATAFMLIRRDVFETLRDNHPEWRYEDDRVENGHSDKICYSFFDFQSKPDGYVGEDYTFCDRAVEHGYESSQSSRDKTDHGCDLGLLQKQTGSNTYHYDQGDVEQTVFADGLASDFLGGFDLRLIFHYRNSHQEPNESLL